MARQQARRRNRERLTGIILAGLGVVVLVVAAIALAAPGSNEKAASSRSASATPTASSSPTSSSSSSAPASSSRPSSTSAPSTGPDPSLSLGGSSTDTAAAKTVPLVVLNNTRTNGLATDAARSFRDGGWKVSDIGNLNNEIVSTCAYYDPDVDGAEAAAKALRKQFPAIKRVVAKFAELPSGPVVVVLTSDYSAG